jgi:hypothetical protein
MKTFCMGCGVEKGLKEEELYVGEYLINDVPIPSLMVSCVSGNEKDTPWKKAVFCHKCFDKLEPDMWIGESCWNSLNPPFVPFEELPEHNNTNCTKHHADFYENWYIDREKNKDK